MLETETYMKHSNEKEIDLKPPKIPDDYVEKISCWFCEKDF